ncbi:conserved hypothetical protein [Burkholderia sp. 8Y]|uniref:CHAP domain-containing protein n=1 Tax=Burkholderia sp. 8Y TaxID=2653133 RepID=UPI0012F12DB3|nr:CHAP domain-containing protein [Burkholderia sp. 8Y]VXC80821.1 conserved hypothetical protein [Burkholderia sp. 8Y]
MIASLLDLFELPASMDGKPVPFCAAGVSYVAAMVYAKASAVRQGVNPPKYSDTGALEGYLTELDHAHFYPTPSVYDMYLVAMGKRRWVLGSGLNRPKPGWIVVYCWTGGKPDHVGIVKAARNSSISTIEFNTSPAHVTSTDQRNGGYVASRERQYPSKYVKGFIRTW